MAKESDSFFAEQTRSFQKCDERVRQLVYRDSEEFKSELHGLLGELNSLDYSVKPINEEVVGELLAKCCYLVPYNDEGLLPHLSYLILNLVSKQQLVLKTNLETITEYLIKSVRQTESGVKADLLRALGAVIYENTHNLNRFHDELIGETGILVDLSGNITEDILRSSTQCIENLCQRVPGYGYLSEKYQAICFKVLLKILHRPIETKSDEAFFCRRTVSCVRGLNNLITSTKSCPQELIGPILAALKVYMLYGLPGNPTAVPSTIYPRPVPLPEATKTPAPTKPAETATSDGVSLRPTPTKPGSGKKNKKKARSRGKERTESESEEATVQVQGGVQNLSLNTEAQVVRPGSLSVDPGQTSGSTEYTIQSLFQPWRHGYSSESDFSDTEGGQSAKLRSYYSNVRQSTLGCLHAVVRSVDKRTMFGYWGAFLPDGTGVGVPIQGQTLFTSLMKDPSPKARSGSLVVLSALVECSKQYLAHADDSDQTPATFTPFSVSLGYMIKELHRGLLFALAAENSPLVLTQIIKCLAVLVPNVPYQKFRPGLLNRLIKHVKPFLAHREPNIRVACLTCLGSIVSVQAPMVEVWQSLKPSPPPTSSSLRSPLSPQDSSGQAPLESRGRTTSESDSMDSSQPGTPRGVSGSVTPTLSSGSITPSLVDFTVGTSELPWIVKLCVKNVIPGMIDVDRSYDRSVIRSANSQPQPVKLESLQLLAQLSKGYFSLIRGSLLLICDLIQKCLEDSDTSVQLHGAKLLEELAGSILQQLRMDLPAQPVDIDVVVEMWFRILSGPLPKILQEPSHYAVRATACDCLANIGPQVLEKLKVDKRVLCITLLLGFTDDSDYHVRASAVRALGVYVLYPCLRDDVSFVADVANSIINSLQETNLSVKVKAAWALGNLSDALVLNKEANDIAFTEDFADMLLLKLFEVATKACQDNDKVKANAVRGLGSLLRYLPERSYKSVRFNAAVDQGIKSLVKTVSSGTMKIRWNACYATSNMFRNRLLPLGEAPWTNDIHSALANVVKSCKNFKVRINAAMAFSVPQERHRYGDQFNTVWVSLVCGLVESESVTDFAEFKYRDSLTEQVSKTLLHLAAIVTLDDLDTLGPALAPYLDSLYPYLERFYNLEREKSDKAVTKLSEDAVKHLQMLESESLTATRKQTVISLKEIFEATKAASSLSGSTPGSPSHSSFSQTYN